MSTAEQSAGLVGDGRQEQACDQVGELAGEEAVVAAARSAPAGELGDREPEGVEPPVQPGRLGGQERRDKRPPALKAVGAVVEGSQIERWIRSVVEVSDQLQVAETAVVVGQLRGERRDQSPCQGPNVGLGPGLVDIEQVVAATQRRSISTSCLARWQRTRPLRSPKWYWTALAFVAPEAAMIPRRLTPSDPRWANSRSADRIARWARRSSSVHPRATVIDKSWPELVEAAQGGDWPIERSIQAGVRYRHRSVPLWAHELPVQQFRRRLPKCRSPGRGVGPRP